MSGKVTVLAYHRIAKPEGHGSDLSPALIDASPAEFDAQMRWLAAHYNVISARKLVDALRDRKPLPPRALMITFDDGYRCFLHTAVPILRRYNLPATLFVATHYIGQPGRPFWWDTLHRALNRSQHTQVEIEGIGRVQLGTVDLKQAAYERLVGEIERVEAGNVEALMRAICDACGIEPSTEPTVLTWDEVEALASAGDITIGPHTRSHPILSRTDGPGMATEIEGSWADLKAHIADPVPLFAYPNGQAYAINQANRDAARKAGMAGAFSMMAGYNTPGKTDPFMMHRIGATAGLSLNRFKLRISPLGGMLRQVKAAIRRT